MPYRLRKAPNKELYWVVGQDGTKHSKEPLPYATAEKQMKALYIAFRQKKEGAGKKHPPRFTEDDEEEPPPAPRESKGAPSRGPKKSRVATAEEVEARRAQFSGNPGIRDSPMRVTEETVAPAGRADAGSPPSRRGIPKRAPSPPKGRKHHFKDADEDAGAGYDGSGSLESYRYMELRTVPQIANVVDEVAYGRMTLDEFKKICIAHRISDELRDKAVEYARKRADEEPIAEVSDEEDEGGGILRTSEGYGGGTRPGELNAEGKMRGGMEASQDNTERKINPLLLSTAEITKNPLLAVKEEKLKKFVDPGRREAERELVKFARANYNLTSDQLNTAIFKELVDNKREIEQGNLGTDRGATFVRFLEEVGATKKGAGKMRGGMKKTVVTSNPLAGLAREAPASAPANPLVGALKGKFLETFRASKPGTKRLLLDEMKDVDTVRDKSGLADEFLDILDADIASGEAKVNEQGSIDFNAYVRPKLKAFLKGKGNCCFKPAPSGAYTPNDTTMGSFFVPKTKFTSGQKLKMVDKVNAEEQALEGKITNALAKKRLAEMRRAGLPADWRRQIDEHIKAVKATPVDWQGERVKLRVRRPHHSDDTELSPKPEVELTPEEDELRAMGYHSFNRYNLKTRQDVLRVLRQTMSGEMTPNEMNKLWRKFNIPQELRIQAMMLHNQRREDVIPEGDEEEEDEGAGYSRFGEYAYFG